MQGGLLISDYQDHIAISEIDNKMFDAFRRPFATRLIARFFPFIGLGALGRPLGRVRCDSRECRLEPDFVLVAT